MNLFNELLAVIERIKEQRYLLIGGLAYSVYAQPRFTQDIDFLISEKEFEVIFDSLVKAGFIDKRNILKFKNATIARCVKMQEPDTVIVDFLLEDEDSFNAVYNKRNVIDYQGIEINVIDPQSLITIKLKRNSKQDQLDVEELKKLNL
jgi:hypothetical protein